MDYEEDFEDESNHNSEAALPVSTRTAHPNRVSKRTGRKRRGMLVHKEIAHTSMSYGRSMGTPNDRLISAKKRTIHVLQNHLGVVQRQLDEVVLENKLLKRVQFRQERELTRINRSESQLPQILYQHSEEMRSMREHLNRSRKANGELQRKVVEISDELMRTRDKAKKLEAVVHKRGLLDRETLTFQLQDANDSIAARDRKIRDLGRVLELTNKNHTQEVRSLHFRQRGLMREVQSLQEEGNNVKLLLKEKGKELEVMNIYSQRRNASIPSYSFTRHSLPLEPLTTSCGCQTTLSLPSHKHATLTLDQPMQQRGTQTDGTTLAKVVAPGKSQVELVPSSKSYPGPSLSTAAYQGPGPSPSLTPSLSSVSAPFQDPARSQGPAPSQGSGPSQGPAPSQDPGPSQSPALSQGLAQAPGPSLNPASSSGLSPSPSVGKSLNPAPSRHPIPPQDQAPASGSYPSIPPSSSSFFNSTNLPQPRFVPSESSTKIPPGAAVGTNTRTSPSLIKDSTSQTRSYQSSFETYSKSTAASSSPKPGEAAKTSSRLLTRKDTDKRSAQSLGSKAMENVTREAKSKPDITEILFGNQQQQAPQSVKPAASVQSMVGKSQSSQSQLDPEKKKQLLAKLMESDSSKNLSNPAAIGVASFADKHSAKSELAEQRTGQEALPGSNASLLSEEEKIENMHKGRPSFFAENDPYGTKLLGTAGVQKPTSAQQPKPRHGRRAEQAAPDGGSSNIQSEEPAAIGYQPSFGRRAGAEARSDSQQLIATRENRPPGKTREDDPFNFSTGLKDQGQSRDYPWEKKVNAGPAGVVTALGENDDVEELAL